MQLVYIDVFNCEEPEAQQRLLSAVTEGRMKLAQRPRFPGKATELLIPNRVPFPGTSSTSPPVMSVTPWQRRQLEGRREALLPEWELRSQKMKQLRTALAISTDPSTKFQLGHQIQAEETHLVAIANSSIRSVFLPLSQPLLRSSYSSAIAASTQPNLQPTKPLVAEVFPVAFCRHQIAQEGNLSDPFALLVA